MSKRILVIDDDRVMRRVIQFALAKTGCEIVLAASGTEAVDMATKTPVDLAVVDLMMEGVDGFQTAVALRQLPGHASLPVVMLTSKGQSDARERAETVGISLFLTKPFSPADLTAHVLSLLNSEDHGDQHSSPVTGN